MPLNSDSHSAEDIPVYASGPMSYIFSGTYEQSYIAHAIMYAACIGPNKDLCDMEQPTGGVNKCQNHRFWVTLMVLVTASIML